MPREVTDSRHFFRPRTVSKPVTNTWDLLPVPPRATRIEFRASGGSIDIRVNNTGNNAVRIKDTSEPFRIKLDKDQRIEVRGASGGEIISCYIE